MFEPKKVSSRTILKLKKGKNFVTKFQIEEFIVKLCVWVQSKYQKYSNADESVSDTEIQRSYARFERQKHIWKNELFEHLGQQIFEIHWLCKTQPHQNTAPIKCQITISKGHLRYNGPVRNFDLCSNSKWPSSKIFLFWTLFCRLSGHPSFVCLFRIFAYA